MGNKNKQITFTDDLDFLSNHWNQLKSIIKNIEDLDDLELIKKKPVKGFSYIKTIQFSQLNENWNVSTRSANLKALKLKLIHMIEKGRSNDIKPMLTKICSGRIKKLKDPHYGSLGCGSFRWNYRAYTLTNKEIQRVIKFFDIKL